MSAPGSPPPVNTWSAGSRTAGGPPNQIWVPGSGPTTASPLPGSRRRRPALETWVYLLPAIALLLLLAAFVVWSQRTAAEAGVLLLPRSLR